jgi:hypothetical protein
MMTIEMEQAAMRRAERKRKKEPASQVSSVYEAWDAPGQRSWHTAIQDAGQRIGAEKTGRPAPNVKSARLSGFWARICQAYEVLLGKAYARPLRQPRMLKQGLIRQNSRV